jgi:hypothetical protein
MYPGEAKAASRPMIGTGCLPPHSKIAHDGSCIQA